VAKQRAVDGEVFAAGGVVTRIVDGERRVGVVVRARYDDVTIPKGHVEKGETIVAAAVREVAEELGCDATPTSFAGATAYRTDEGQKYVLFWHMDWVGDLDDGPTGHEIAERRWLAHQDAIHQLSYADERRLLAGASEEGSDAERSS
jgi:8-oxo-dGTP diphosphatase